jgi:hypothetical protein
VDLLARLCEEFDSGAVVLGCLQIMWPNSCCSPLPSPSIGALGLFFAAATTTTVMQPTNQTNKQTNKQTTFVWHPSPPLCTFGRVEDDIYVQLDSLLQKVAAEEAKMLPLEAALRDPQKGAAVGMHVAKFRARFVEVAQH